MTTNSPDVPVVGRYCSKFKSGFLGSNAILWGNVTTGRTLVIWRRHTRVPLLFQREMSRFGWSKPQNTLPCRKTGQIHRAVATFLQKGMYVPRFSKIYPAVSGNNTLPPAVGRQTACKPSNQPTTEHSCCVLHIIGTQEKKSWCALSEALSEPYCIHQYPACTWFTKTTKGVPTAVPQ